MTKPVTKEGGDATSLPGITTAESARTRASLAQEIGCAPAPVALLDVFKRKGGNFETAKPTTKENGEDGAVTQPAQTRYIRRAHEGLRLPASCPHGCPRT